LQSHSHLDARDSTQGLAPPLRPQRAGGPGACHRLETTRDGRWLAPSLPGVRDLERPTLIQQLRLSTLGTIRFDRLFPILIGFWLLIAVLMVICLCCSDNHLLPSFMDTSARSGSVSDRNGKKRGQEHSALAKKGMFRYVDRLLHESTRALCYFSKSNNTTCLGQCLHLPIHLAANQYGS